MWSHSPPVLVGLQTGADPNARAVDGSTALMLAAGKGRRAWNGWVPCGSVKGQAAIWYFLKRAQAK